ncbi:MAG: hypothetical protein KF749_14240 [Bacteroidetes bacterium]|nr:hypothetical protein [Bacteroidota bacterium]MCW5894078.1 hypothetical protein [Bacteroidota bacterium]
MKKNSQYRIHLSALFAGTLLVLVQNISSSQPIDQEMMKKSSVVFVGTISQTGAASFAEVPVSNTTSVVKVDQILQQPSAISIKEGEEITLELKASLAPGTRSLFYTDGWILGQGVALREIGHTPLPATMSPAAQDDLRKQFFASRKAMMEAQFRARIDSADIVALGKVTSIQPSPPETQKRITEHDPEWHDAIVKVSKGVKGIPDGAEIVVRFPMSMDIAFYGAPKLGKGDERVMILRTDTRSGMGKAQVAGREVGAYIAEQPSDFLEKGQLQQVIELMKR